MADTTKNGRKQDQTTDVLVRLILIVGPVFDGSLGYTYNTYLQRKHVKYAELVERYLNLFEYMKTSLIT